MKLKELIEKYGECEIKDLELIKKDLELPNEVWLMDIGDNYYTIESDGSIGNHIWKGLSINLNHREIGNCFMTIEEAKKELNRRKIEVIMLKYGRRHYIKNKVNYEITWNTFKETVRVDCYDCFTDGNIYFDTEKLAQKAADEIGKERLKEYFITIQEEKK